MWPFKKKKLVLPDLPKLSQPVSKKEEEIALLPEDKIPEELPELEIKTKMTKPIKASIAKKAEQTIEEFSVEPEVHTEKPVKASGNKYVSTEKYREMLSEINNVKIDFDNIDFGITRVVEFKEQRDEKTESLQEALDEAGKKLMQIEETLFGG